MHRQYRNAAVNNVHAIQCKDVSDGSAAADVYLAKLCGLGNNALLAENITKMRDELSVGIVGAALSAGARKLVEDHSASKEGRILLIEALAPVRIKGRGYIAGEHVRVCKAAAKLELCVLTAKVHDLSQCIFKIMRLHSGCADRSDLLLVYQKADTGTLRCSVLPVEFPVQNCAEGGICTNPVIMSVAKDHAAVKACVSCRTCGNDFQLCGLKIILLDAVHLFQNGEKRILDSLLRKLLLLFPGLGLRINDDRLIANDEVKRLTLNDLGRLLLHLILCEVNQKIGNKEYGIVCILTNVQDNRLAVLFYDHAVNGKRSCDKLILLDAAVVMGIKISVAALLIQRVLLDIHAGAVNVCAQNIDALLHGTRPEAEQHHRLIHPGHVYLVAGLKLFPILLCLLDGTGELYVSGILRRIHKGVHALSFRLVLGNEPAIILRKGKTALLSLQIIGIPHIYSFHFFAPFFTRLSRGYCFSHNIHSFSD